MLRAEEEEQDPSASLYYPDCDPDCILSKKRLIPVQVVSVNLTTNQNTKKKGGSNNIIQVRAEC